jgi:hypothetical protein
MGPSQNYTNILFCSKVCVVTSRNKDSVSLAEIQSADIIIGTSCAGTGLDTAVEYIIVLGLPFSIEQLLQWAGRCRINGTVSVFVPKFHLRKDDEMSGKDAMNLHSIMNMSPY